MTKTRGQGNGEMYETIYRNLWATALTPEQHERTCNYWFTVTVGATAHTAFETRAGLDRWLAERGLVLETPALDADGITGARFTRIIGEYREASHGDFAPTEEQPYRMVEGASWPPVSPIAATAAMSNGQYTLALITETAGVRTIHTLNPNVRTRIIFDRRAADALMR